MTFLCAALAERWRCSVLKAKARPNSLCRTDQISFIRRHTDQAVLSSANCRILHLKALPYTLVLSRLGIQVECNLDLHSIHSPVVRKIRPGAWTSFLVVFFTSHQVNSHNTDQVNKPEGVWFDLLNFLPKSCPPLCIKLLAFVCRSAAHPNVTSCQIWSRPMLSSWTMRKNVERAKNEKDCVSYVCHYSKNQCSLLVFASMRHRYVKFPCECKPVTISCGSGWLHVYTAVWSTFF